MLSFVIFESDAYLKDMYIKIIKRFLYTAQDYYKIHEFNEFNCLTLSKIHKIEGERIYIISSDLDGMNGFDLARKIRQDGDVRSSIIIVVPNDKKYSIESIRNTSVLNVIEQSDNFIKELLETIELAYRIATRYDSLAFSSFDEVYRLPYDDIYFIEKNFHDDTITIHTKDDTYLHYTSIRRMADKLSNDPRFLKCQRSCIVNLYKIACYNSKDNLVVFDNGMTTDLVSREFKRILTDRLKKGVLSKE